MIKIRPFPAFDEQRTHIGNHHWSVARLIMLSAHLPVMDIPLSHLNIYHSFGKMTLRDMVMHIKAVEDANLNYPIILDEDGEVLDGRHRIMKAILAGQETIRAIRFEFNPVPDSVEETE